MNGLAILYPRGMSFTLQRHLTSKWALSVEFGFGFPERSDFYSTRLYPQKDLVRSLERIYNGLSLGRYYFSGHERSSWHLEAFVMYYYDHITLSNVDCYGCTPTADWNGSAIMTGLSAGPGFGYSFALEDDFRILLGFGVAIAQRRQVGYQVRDLTTGEVSHRLLDIGTTEYGFSARVLFGVGRAF